MNRTGIIGATAIWATLSCAGEDMTCLDGEDSSPCAAAPAGVDATPTVPLHDRLSALETDLTLGSRGAGVRAVQEYLTSIGYFPNERLREHYADWRPIFAEAPLAGVFDDPTAEAIRAVQRASGVDDTGIVDADTRAVLRGPRCGVPEGLRASHDPSEKFTLYSDPPWPKTQLTWSLLNLDDDLALPAATNAVAAGLASWSKQSTLTFTMDPVADITIRWVDDREMTNRGKPAEASRPPFGDIKLNREYNWVISTNPSGNDMDLESTVLHEAGHAIGLNHSKASRATMNALVNNVDRTLDLDDQVGIGLLYNAWDLLDGQATAIDVGGGQCVSVGVDLGTIAFRQRLQDIPTNWLGLASDQEQFRRARRLQRLSPHGGRCRRSLRRADERWKHLEAHHGHRELW